MRKDVSEIEKKGDEFNVYVESKYSRGGYSAGL